MRTTCTLSMKDDISTQNSDGTGLIADADARTTHSREKWLAGQSRLDLPSTVSHEAFGREMPPRSLPDDLAAETSIELKRDGMRISMNVPVRPDMLADPVQ